MKRFMLFLIENEPLQSKLQAKSQKSSDEINWERAERSENVSVRRLEKWIHRELEDGVVGQQGLKVNLHQQSNLCV